MKSRNLLYVLGTLIALILIPNVNFSQCGNNFNLENYTVLESTQSVSIVPEISGMTYNDNTGEFIAVSDEGAIAKRHPSGAWSGIGVNSYGDPHCVNTRFSDMEAITYMTSYTASLHRYAIADERDRSIVFVDMTDSQTALNHPPVSYLKFSGLPCEDSNNGIEGIAYDINTNTMYFATEYSDQKIYKFIVPATIVGQTVSVQEVVDLQNVSGLSTYSTHALDILPNGNVVAMVTKPGSGDNGLFERMLIEIDPCGTVMSRVDLEPTISNSAELEGVAVVGDNIYVIGENEVMYQLRPQVQASIQVVSPGTLGSYDAGSSQLVNWISTAVNGNVKIELYKSGSFVSTLNSSTSNDGSQSVTLPNVTTTGTGYSVVVTSLNDLSISGSSGDFTIAAPAGTVTLTGPPSNSSFTVGSAMPISWTSSGLAGNVKLELYQASTLISTLAASTSNDGNQSVLVPALPDGNNYRIRISSVNTPSVDDFGSFFSITNLNITVTSPVSGATYQSGGQVNVAWTSNTSGNMKIDLYKGSSFILTLNTSTADDGTQTVTLPTVNITAGDYFIRVTNLNNANIFDNSQNFEITAIQVFDVTSPSSGNVFGEGDNIQVSWNSSYTGTVRIELYQGNSLITTLRTSTADDGSDTVSLPNSFPATANNYSIKVINREDTSVFDFSDDFTITVADFIDVTSPISTDIFDIGDPITVQWTSNMGGNVRIDLYENNALIANLASSTSNDQMENLTIPVGITGGPNCVIRVTSLSDNNVFDDSQEFFIDNPQNNLFLADLIVTNVGNAGQAGNIFTVTGITVVNQGDLDASNYEIGAYLSTDSNLTLGDFRMGTIASVSNTVGGGGTETNSFSIDLSQLGLADGTYYFGVIADDFDAVTEELANKLNNYAVNTSNLAVISSAPPSACISITNGTYTESFESGTGGWSQSSGDDMDWTSTSGSTPSYLTGPSSAQDGSRYLFTESSNGNRNKTAKLVSPCFSLANTVNPTFSFQCHMFGSTMGSLQVVAIDQATNQASTIFSQLGNQGDQWIDVNASLAAFIGRDIKFEFIGITGVSYRSDMAIDMVVIKDNAAGCALAGTPCDDGDVCTIGESYDSNCNCTGGTYTDNDNDSICIGNDEDDNDACVPVANASCATCSSTVNGSFMDGFNSNFIYWTQSNSDDNQWIRQSGSTPSSKTGPSSAEEGSHYVFVEASYGGYPFKKAKMNSVCIDLSTLSTPKLSFSYHMYGSSMGALQIAILNTATGVKITEYNQNGNQGDQWHDVQIDLSPYANQTIQIVVEATTGYGFRSDIALDNIEVSNTAGNFSGQAETRNFVELSSINEVEEDFAEMKIYPNPAKDVMTVAFESQINGEARLVMHNTQGQVLLERTEIVQEGEMEKVLDISGLAAGTYHLTLSSKQTRIYQNVVVIK